MPHNKRTTEHGFTLIEIMTSVSIFLVIMTISMGSILGVFDADRKSASLRGVMGNFNFAIEAMAKEARFGNRYHCNDEASSSSSWTTTRNCSNTNGTDNELLSFLSSEGVQTTYRFNTSGQNIQKRVGSNWVAVTPPEVIIQDMRFVVVGTTAGDTTQPKVLLKIKGYAGTGKGRSDFTLQTLITQRTLDI